MAEASGGKDSRAWNTGACSAMDDSGTSVHMWDATGDWEKSDEMFEQEQIQILDADTLEGLKQEGLLDARESDAQSKAQTEEGACVDVGQDQGDEEEEEALRGGAGGGDAGGDAGGGDSPAKEKKKRKKKARMAVNLDTCSYSVVSEVCQSLGWKIVEEKEGSGMFANNGKWNLKWIDRYVFSQSLKDLRLQRGQKLNHFPAMYEVALKCRMASNLNRMRKLMPEEYSFFPDTWVLPEDFLAFKKVTEEHKNRTYIMKPNGGCQGRDIFFTRKATDAPKEGRWVAQRYINKPLLIPSVTKHLRSHDRPIEDTSQHVRIPLFLF